MNCVVAKAKSALPRVYGAAGGKDEPVLKSNLAADMDAIRRERVDKEIGVRGGGAAGGSKRSRKKSSGGGGGGGGGGGASEDPFGGSDEDCEEEFEEGEEEEEPSVVGPSINPASFNVDAQRTLLRIRQKLQGLEDPNGEALSVEGQVKVLVNQARDQETLGLMYDGWSAFW